MAFVNVTGPVVAETVYANNKLVAKDVELTLPAVTPTTADVQAMGTMSVPIPQLLENMELSITKIGTDLGLSSMLSFDAFPIEVRWVQSVTDANGKVSHIGCKVFLRCMSTVLPEVGLAPGEASENELTYTVTRYQLVQDGQEAWLIDRLAGICRVYGKDYMGNISSML